VDAWELLGARGDANPLVAKPRWIGCPSSIGIWGCVGVIALSVELVG
jgi:hypothetical protein